MRDAPIIDPGDGGLTGKRAEMARRWATTPWTDVALFIGPNAERFRPTWEQMRAQTLKVGGTFVGGLCWPALFLGFAWFFYRKLWAWGVAFLLLPVAIGLLLPLKGAAIGMAAATAVLAKTVYLQHATSRIAAIRAGGGDDAALAAAGGTSLAGALLGGALLLLAVSTIVLATVLMVTLPDR